MVMGVLSPLSCIECSVCAEFVYTCRFGFEPKWPLKGLMCARLAICIWSLSLNLVAYFCIFHVVLAFCNVGVVGILNMGGYEFGGSLSGWC